LFLIKIIFCLSILYLNYGNKDTALRVYLFSAQRTPSQQYNTSREAATTSQQLYSTTLSALTLCRTKQSVKHQLHLQPTQFPSTSSTVRYQLQFPTSAYCLPISSTSSASSISGYHTPKAHTI